jgi:alpha-L-arabinofuranosidase
MKAVDPTIELIACGHKGDVAPQWTPVLLAECADIVDTLTVHLLFFNNNNSSPEYSYVNQIGYSYIVEDLFRRLHALGHQHGADVKIAITECFQATTRAYHTRPSAMSEVIYYTGITNASIRTQGTVNFHTHTSLVNLAGGMSREFGVVYPHPVFHARSRLVQLVGAQPVGCTVTTPFRDIPDWQPSWAGDTPRQYPLIDALPLVQGETLHVSLLNRDPHAETRVHVRIAQGNATADRAQVWRLAGTTWHAANSALSPQRVRPTTTTLALEERGGFGLSLPPASLTLVTLPVKRTGADSEAER